VVLYILLCGFPPFYAESDEQLFDLISEGQYEFPSPHWDTVSKEGSKSRHQSVYFLFCLIALFEFNVAAKNLVTRMLCVDSNVRCTATQALNHPWVIVSDIELNHATLPSFSLPIAFPFFFSLFFCFFEIWVICKFFFITSVADPITLMFNYFGFFLAFFLACSATTC
jgi:serine/threonine protein kinase